MIHFAHFAVKQYLARDDRFRLATASAAIAKTCLTYLRHVKEVSLESIRSDFPLASYGAEVWIHYMRIAEHSDDIVQKVLSFLQDKAALEQSVYLDKCLPENGADANAERGEYRSPLQAASFEGHQDVVQILGARAKVNIQGGRYGTALLLASAGGHPQIVQLLLDVHFYSSCWQSDLGHASENGQLKTVQLLLDKREHVKVEDGYYSDAVHAASQAGQLEVVKLLLHEVADVKANVSDSLYTDDFYDASSEWNLEILQLLLENGAEFDVKGGHLGSALHNAWDRGHHEVFEFLLEQESDTDAGGKYGTALPNCSAEGRYEAMQFLVDNEEDVNVGDEYGTTLQIAAVKGYYEIVQLLRERSAATSSQASKV
ncbi:hypothetical protein CSUB01_02414 [Colletotrichum sublineola]|uniref:Uncharacterized protein n=1 Tax=Colletotrichum sublineola TaxID=1173701 RepID=A0A066X3W5_COLSU|nr:hypothetical protein CSUB01_02414 [Colletotrichum sublineola]